MNYSIEVFYTNPEIVGRCKTVFYAENVTGMIEAYNLARDSFKKSDLHDVKFGACMLGLHNMCGDEWRKK